MRVFQNLLLGRMLLDLDRHDRSFKRLVETMDWLPPRQRKRWLRASWIWFQSEDVRIGGVGGVAVTLVRQECDRPPYG